MSADIHTLDRARLERYGQYTTVCFHHAPASDLANMTIESTEIIDPVDLRDWLMSAVEHLTKEVIRDAPEAGVGQQEEGRE